MGRKSKYRMAAIGEWLLLIEESLTFVGILKEPTEVDGAGKQGN